MCPSGGLIFVRFGGVFSSLYLFSFVLNATPAPGPPPFSLIVPLSSLLHPTSRSPPPTFFLTSSFSLFPIRPLPSSDHPSLPSRLPPPISLFPVPSSFVRPSASLLSHPPSRMSRASSILTTPSLCHTPLLPLPDPPSSRPLEALFASQVVKKMENASDGVICCCLFQQACPGGMVFGIRTICFIILLVASCTIWARLRRTCPCFLRGYSPCC